MLDLPAWRLANGHTQASLAKALGAALRTLSRWEKGKTAQPADLAQRLLLVTPGSAVAKAPKAATITPKTYPALFRFERVGRAMYSYAGATHPRTIMTGDELAPFLVPGTTIIYAAVLDDPIYTTRLPAIQAATALPAAPRMTEEDFAAKILAGASLDELFKK